MSNPPHPFVVAQGRLGPIPERRGKIDSGTRGGGDAVRKVSPGPLWVISSVSRNLYSGSGFHEGPSNRLESKISHFVRNDSQGIFRRIRINLKQ
jgi:hypothetical protein